MKQSFAGTCMLLLLSSCTLQSQWSANSPTDLLRQSSLKECGDSLFSDMVTPLGYPFASFTTTTDDGYVLKLFRMQAKNSRFVAGKPAVLLQHGIFDSADDWVINGESGSLGFVLANAGYDVWLGNSRGNKYSRENVHLKPSHREFWDFSFQEMGEFDVKATLGFISSFTGQDKLIYVGHSQGTSQMFAALSDPQVSKFVNSKVKKFLALAPVVFLANCESKLLAELAEDSALIEGANLFGIEEWLPGACSKTSAQSEFEYFVCSKAPVFCDALLSLFDYNPAYDNHKVLPTFAQHFPSGSSLRSLRHYAQLLASDKHDPRFLKFDFGFLGNLRRYGQRSPPAYDFGLLGVPVRSFVGLDDKLGDATDNSFVSAHLQALGKDFKAYTYDNCGHATFMIGLDPAPIFRDVLAELAAS